jgi:hypothetical protein
MNNIFSILRTHISKRSMMKKIMLLILSCLFSLQVFSWGKIGHRVTGEVATQHLTKKTKLELSKLLDGQTLAQVSNWADFIKSDAKMRKKYSHLHYKSFGKDIDLAKAPKTEKGDILSAIADFTSILKDKKSKIKDKILALKFLAHLVGDVHQPLHVGYAHDKGGNDVKVDWFGQKTNLHAVWDEKLIQSQELSFTEYTAFINHATPSEVKQWQKTGEFVWAKESRSYTPKTYEFKAGKYWEYAYAYKHIKYLEQRLLMGGVRLAGLLNQIFK